MNFDKVCPGGNIAAQVHPNAPAETERDDDYCDDCGQDAEDCVCNINEDDPRDDR